MMKPDRLIAIGDIHGCFDSLQILVEEKIHLKKTDRIVFLGDYIDRGPKSKEVIDFILNLISKGYDIITLMGNHELMLLDAFKEDQYIPLWFINGGIETLKSFGLKATINLPDIYWKFFLRLQYYYSYENHLFVHAGFNDNAFNPFEDTHHMLWSRNEHYTNPIFEGNIIVHGHSPIPLELCKSIVEQHKKVINIDTGCVYIAIPGGGKLTGIDVFTHTIYTV